MSMSSIIVAARLPAASTEARQKIADHLRAVGEYSRANEPGVWRFMVLSPREEVEGTDVWAIEEYADQAALDAHLAAPPVKDLIAYMSSTPSPLGGAPIIRSLGWTAGMHFSKPVDAADPLVVFGHFTFKDGGRRKAALAHLLRDVRASEAEKGTLVYGMLGEKEGGKGEEMFSVEVYESEAFFRNVHLASDAVQETMRETRDLIEGFEMVSLRVVGGFAGR